MINIEETREKGKIRRRSIRVSNSTDEKEKETEKEKKANK